MSGGANPLSSLKTSPAAPSLDHYGQRLRHADAPRGYFGLPLRIRPLYARAIQLYEDRVGDLGQADRQFLEELEMKHLFYIKLVVKEYQSTETMTFAWNFKLHVLGVHEAVLKDWPAQRALFRELQLRGKLDGYERGFRSHAANLRLTSLFRQHILSGIC